MGFLGGGVGGNKRKKLPGIEEGSESEEISKEISTHANTTDNSITNRSSSTPKKKGGWFGRTKHNEDAITEGDDNDDDENHQQQHSDFENDPAADDSSSLNGRQQQHNNSTTSENDASSATGTSKGTDSLSHRPCETIPDNENEFHLAIQAHDWDALDMLLRDYDFKKYKRPVEKPKKKNAKKLRIAKYLPEMPELPWKKEAVYVISPLYGLDALGRTPLHLCCIHPVPHKLLVKLLFVARDAASVPDETKSLPIHLAVNHERNVEVIDKLIRGYYPGSWQGDGHGKTPFMWAVEMAKRRQEEENKPKTSTFWGFPSMQTEREWQQTQEKVWTVTTFLIENRHARRKKLLPQEYKQIIHCLGLAAPPELADLLLTTGVEALKKEEIAGPCLSLCITRQYPLELLERLVEECPIGMPKLHKDSTGRGLVSAHYKVGCVAHQDPDDPNHRRESFRMTMQRVANSNHELEDDFEPPAPYLDWWGKLKLIIHLWGSHTKPTDDLGSDDDEEEEFDEDDLLLHSALSNPDVPPSLIQLLAMMYPHTLDFEHPKSSALPIHLACRLWRHRQFPPRRGEKEINFDKVVVQLLHGDDARTRKRYKDRLPLHHAVASGKNWSFIKPLVVSDRKSLHIRDPNTKLYPYQLAAGRTELKFDLVGLTKHQFTPSAWDKLRDYEQDHECRKVEHFYDLEQLTVIFELLRHSPDAIDHAAIKAQEAARRAQGPQRLIIVEGIEASDEVATSMQIKMIRASFGLGNVSGHFIAWCYESTRRGWKTHRSNFAIVKEAIMDGFVPTRMDKWWRKLKFWIWQDCPWDNIPRRDDFLVHGAICNPDTSPWIIELLLECFPRSASIPIPQSNGCYPLHIACITDRYAPLPFEFPNKRTAIEMAARAFPDAVLLKYEDRLPLHLAISHCKQWDEIRYLSEEEPVGLAVPDPKTHFFAFQMSALNRPYTKEQRKRFEMLASKEVGKEQWRNLTAHEKVINMSKVLETHEFSMLECVWELLKRNTTLVHIPIDHCEDDVVNGVIEEVDNELLSGDYMSQLNASDTSNKNWIESVDEANLSMASLDFLDDVYETDNTKKLMVEERKKRANSMDSARSSLDLAAANASGSSMGSGSFNIAQKEQLYSVDNDKSTKKNQERSDNVKSRSDDEGDGQSMDYMEYEEYEEYEDYEEVDPNFDGAGSIHPDEEEYDDGVQEELQRSLEKEIKTTHAPLHSEEPYLESVVDKSQMVPDGSLVYRPRRRNIVLVTKSSAFIIWKNAVMEEGSLKPKAKKNYWLRVLKKLGEEIDITELPMIRYEQEQSTISSLLVDNSSVVIDEDDNYVWVMCGARAASIVENYDIESAVELTSFLFDKDTHIWLRGFYDGEHDLILNGTDNPLLVVDWILTLVENGSDRSEESKEFLVSRENLRHVFGFEPEDEEGEEIVKNSIKRLCYDVSGCKLDSRFQYREPLDELPIQPQVEPSQSQFSESTEKDEFLKLLKKKQKLDGKNEIEAHDNTRSISSSGDRILSSDVVVNPSIGDHLQHINQPTTEYDDGGESLGSADLFDEPSGPPPAKPLLAAAKKAAAARANSEAKGKTYSQPETRHGSHLDNINQPKVVSEDDNDSIGPDGLFDEPKGPPPKKPLLAAAKKAAAAREKQQMQARAMPEKEKEQLNSQAANAKERHNPMATKASLAPAASVDAKKGTHLNDMNQPKTEYEDDDGSIGVTDLFDEPKGPPPKKPLLTAAKKAAAAREKQQMQARAAAEKEKEELRQKAAAVKAKQGHMAPKPKPPAAATEEDRKGSHLNDMNQPKTEYEDDDGSIGVTDLFDEPKGPPPKKPLLAAAKKAAAAREKQRVAGDKEKEELRSKAAQERHNPMATKTKPPPTTEEGAKKGTHLNDMNQPKTEYEDDAESIGVTDLFDEPKGPPPKKPLLTAAKKAAAEREKQKLQATAAAEKSRRGSKTASVVPQQAQAVKKAAPSRSAENDMMGAHPKDMNQSATEYDDSGSIGIDNLIDEAKVAPPPKSLRAAAAAAKAPEARTSAAAKAQQETEVKPKDWSNDRQERKSPRQASKDDKETEQATTEKQIGSVPPARKEHKQTGEVKVDSPEKEPGSLRSSGSTLNASMDLGDVFTSPSKTPAKSSRLNAISSPSKNRNSGMSNEDRRRLVKSSLDHMIEGETNETIHKAPQTPKDEPGQPTTPNSILKKSKIGREKRVRKNPAHSDKAKRRSANDSNEGSLTLSGVFGVEGLGAPPKKNPRKPAPSQLPAKPAPKKMPAKTGASPASIERRAMSAKLVRMNSIDHIKQEKPDLAKANADEPPKIIRRAKRKPKNKQTKK